MLYWQSFRYSHCSIMNSRKRKHSKPIQGRIHYILSLNPSTNNVFSSTVKNNKSDACEVAVGIQLWLLTNKTVTYTQV